MRVKADDAATRRWYNGVEGCTDPAGLFFPLFWLIWMKYTGLENVSPSLNPYPDRLRVRVRVRARVR